ncbi:hypothetical protein HYH03_001308 [Edaphochlamys debaryana]|uniref:Rieske domain-containing protein n=1 Tax=Edaphochlamys debaryana TaxID=47281 RepID=A0A836C4U0_9CHLO|nr:hypothetical protein HYH03_001308 [Edaphochlamys debaryana]|eukprot:KAG2500531.1 hypothetical protein HYH03_001308 [Edaphochlamys debaryana]
MALSARPCVGRVAVSRRTVKPLAAWTKAGTTSGLKSAGGKQVVEINGQKVLLVAQGDDVKAVSNKCSHLGLPLVGKTAMFQAEIKSGCVVCPAHGTMFDLDTGAVKGEWCPKLPNLPLVGKGPAQKPLPTFQVRVGEDGSIEVNV